MVVGDGKALTLCSAVPLGFQALKKNLKKCDKIFMFFPSFRHSLS